MRANHEINSMVDQPASEFALFVGDVLAVFNSPMNQANHEICVRTSIGNCGIQAKTIRCRGDLRAGSRPNVADRQESDFFPIEHGEETRRASFGVGFSNSDWQDLFAGTNALAQSSKAAAPKSSA